MFFIFWDQFTLPRIRSQLLINFRCLLNSNFKEMFSNNDYSNNRNSQNLDTVLELWVSNIIAIALLNGWLCDYGYIHTCHSVSVYFSNIIGKYCRCWFSMTVVIVSLPRPWRELSGYRWILSSAKVNSSLMTVSLKRQFLLCTTA